VPLPSEYGTCKTVKARFWTWLSGKRYNTFKLFLLRSEADLLERFRGGLVFKAHRLVYHSTLGLRVITKKKDLLDVVRPLAMVTLS